MKIILDDLTNSIVHQLLEEHLDDMRAISPPGSCHALDLSKLRTPDISFWTIWSDEGTLLGTGALKDLGFIDGQRQGEVKSMRTPNALRRQGAGRKMLEHIIATAQAKGFDRLNLETGGSEPFHAALGLYESFGFARCGPFGGYREDPFSVFMTKDLR